MVDDDVVGVIGRLHPGIAKTFDLDKGPILFELNTDHAFATNLPNAIEISKYPMIRRDIAVIVDDKVSAASLVAAVESTASDLIGNVRIFDVYSELRRVADDISNHVEDTKVRG